MMSRGHTPFGYRMENGAAVIVPEEAAQIRKIYDGYLAGLSYCEAARDVGLTMQHGSVKRLIQNTHYLGDEFYPAIIDRETFDAAEAERKRRLEIMGRTNIKKAEPKTRQVKTHFTMKPIMRQTKDPYEQAAYIYSLIESEA